IHLGNARAMVVFDLVYRVLLSVYKNVNYIRNITDVDDKIINRAQDLGINPLELTAKTTADFHDCLQQLHCLKPTSEPKATDHIDDMIKMIKQLINNNYAYEASGHVYYKTESFADYGKLTNRKLNELNPGARIEVNSGKQSPYDFVLWKQCGKDEYGFDSPFGYGRPGWHIECSAMSTKYLGPTFDIHGGGADLKFPHHSNEIAQSCACYPKSEYARYWLHNGFVTVNGEKMSKSLGNFITANELVQQQTDGEVVRLALLSAHYRKPLDWHPNILSQAKHALNSWYRCLEEVDSHVINQAKTIVPNTDLLSDLYDDFNSLGAIAKLHLLAKNINRETNAEKRLHLQQQLIALMSFMGLLNHTPTAWFKHDNTDIANTVIKQLVAQRQQAKSDKDYQEADAIRNKLLSMGIVIEDKPGGKTTWRQK
ncbi:MAG: cysteine--tRNA ligase, partial [Pseudomonadota bacterium]